MTVASAPGRLSVSASSRRSAGIVTNAPARGPSDACTGTAGCAEDCGAAACAGVAGRGWCGAAAGSGPIVVTHRV
jgi:hypothetical protein